MRRSRGNLPPSAIGRGRSRTRAEREQLLRDEVAWRALGRSDAAVDARLDYLETFRGRRLRAELLVALDEYLVRSDPKETVQLVVGMRSLLHEQRRRTCRLGMHALWQLTDFIDNPRTRRDVRRALALGDRVYELRAARQVAVRVDLPPPLAVAPKVEPAAVNRMRSMLTFVPVASPAALRVLQDEMLDTLAAEPTTAGIVTRWAHDHLEVFESASVRDALDLVLTEIGLSSRVGDEVAAQARRLRARTAGAAAAAVPHFPHADRSAGGNGPGRVGDRGPAGRGWA
ncbi:MAG: hypothetical protein ACOYNI_07755 [Acidimicrobiia bacterium]